MRDKIFLVNCEKNLLALMPRFRANNSQSDLEAFASVPTYLKQPTPSLEATHRNQHSSERAKQAWRGRIDLSVNKYKESLTGPRGLLCKTEEKMVAIIKQPQPDFLPSFFVLGPPRTGTTWLHKVLQNHARLPSPAKETRFFDVHFHRGLNWYRAHYPSMNPARPVGKLRPHISLRMKPASISHALFHTHEWSAFFVIRSSEWFRYIASNVPTPMISWNFEEALYRDPELLESSKYVSKLAAWRTALGTRQVLATVYDDLRDNPQAYMDALTAFIGVRQFDLSSSQSSSVHALTS